MANQGNKLDPRRKGENEGYQPGQRAPFRGKEPEGTMAAQPARPLEGGAHPKYSSTASPSIRGRRSSDNGEAFVHWRTIEDLDTNKMMNKIRAEVNISFYLRYVYSYQLENIENGDVIVHYTNEGSLWFNNLPEAEKWLNQE